MSKQQSHQSHKSHKDRKAQEHEDHKTRAVSALHRHSDHDHDVKKLASLIKDIQVAMLTTVDKSGVLHSRPMATQQFEFDGCLWFMTNESSPKVCELLHECHVNVSYSGDNHSYISVSGVAHLVFDKDKIRELWRTEHYAWFPKGMDDPNLALIAVEVHQAEYWQAPSSAVIKLLGFARSVLTGEAMSESGKKLDLTG